MKIAIAGVLMAAVGALTALGLAAGRPTTGVTPLRGTAADQPEENDVQTAENAPEGQKIATFGSGCFWCTEAVFELMDGVSDVVSGFEGGRVPNPSYEAVCTGATGHAEVVQVTYEPAVVSYPQLLEAFWGSHDPTTLNRQGNDSGTQYRSVIYYHDEDQRAAAEELKTKLDSSGAFNRPIVTAIEPADTFYPAESYHQDYYRKNPSAGYCQVVIVPKIQKFRKVFAEALKP